MLAWRVLKFALYLVTVFPFSWLYVRLKGTRGPWVIGGHSGRTYGDNAAALHEYIASKTDQDVVWITSAQDVEDDLRRKGYSVLKKDTVRSRLALWSAEVLIRSHGHGDLDSFLAHYLRPPGLMIYLNHCQNHLKAGQLYAREVDNMTQTEKERYKRSLFYFDYLLASSPKEQENFRLSFPHRADRIVLDGGAHIDALIRGKQTVTPQQTILYFPTFREASIPARQTVADVVDRLIKSETLRAWLRTTKFKFQICAHINDHSLQRVATRAKYPIEIIPTNQIIDAMLACTLFISDYSGLVFDYLILDRPLLLFPFDLSAYLSVRKLYVDYDDIQCGPVARNVRELMAVLTSDAWRDLGPYKDRRAQLKKEIFVSEKPDYAERSFFKIRSLLAEASSARCPPTTA